MYYTYLLRSVQTGKIYIGQTCDLGARIRRHNAGQSVYTKNKGPWELMYYFEFTTRSEAIALENKLKRLKNGSKALLWAQRNGGVGGRPDD